MTSSAKPVGHLAGGHARPLLLFFYSPTQGQSRRVEGFIAQVLQRRQNHKVFSLMPINVHERPDLTKRFRIASAPTLLVVADNRVQARLEAPRGCEPIKQALQPWLRS
jgi:thioredoxin-like negative regulator of GroEL